MITELTQQTSSDNVLPFPRVRIGDPISSVYYYIDHGTEQDLQQGGLGFG